MKEFENSFLEWKDDILAIAPDVIKGLLILIILWIVANAVRAGIKNRLATRLKDPLLIRFLARIVSIIIKGIGILVFLKYIGLGNAATTLIGAAGVGTLVVGFAMKDIGEHMFAGIMLAFNRPFRVGDTIEIVGYIGKVIDISLRNTHIKTFDGKDVYIPNGNLIKNPLSNLTIDGFIRTTISVGIAYDADARNAISLIRDILEAEPGIITETKEPTAYVTSFGASSIDITAYYWIDPTNPQTSNMTISSNIIQKINSAFKEASIDIPYQTINVISNN